MSDSNRRMEIVEAITDGECPFCDNQHRISCKNTLYTTTLETCGVNDWNSHEQSEQLDRVPIDLREIIVKKCSPGRLQLHSFQTVADHAHDWEYLVNPLGSLIYVSPGCERVTGYTPEEFLQKSDLIVQIVHPEDRSTVVDHFLSVDPSLPNEIDFRIITRRGEIRWIEHSCHSVHDNEGACLGRRIINRDKTDCKSSGEVLMQKCEHKERSNRDLEQFAYIAAHDLRQPLVAVAAYLRILQGRSRNLSDKNIHKCLSNALDLTLRMDCLLQGLLASSRLTMSSERYETTDGNACLKNVLSNLKFAIDKCKGVVTWDSLPTLGINTSELVQIFQSLIGNAIKFRKPKHPLKVHVACQSQGTTYQFSISDNGMGIEPPYIDRMLKTYERISGSPHDHAGQIGLSICKKILEKNGGRLWVDSKPGKGTTFYFTLPAIQSQDISRKIRLVPERVAN